MSISRDMYNMIAPMTDRGGFDAYGNWISRREQIETYDEFLARTGRTEGPSMSARFAAGVTAGVSGYKALKQQRDAAKRQSEQEYKAELERQQQAERKQADAERRRSDQELIRKRALEQVRLGTLKNYDYHEMMTHYFLGIDSKGRPFDVDSYGVPYYLNIDKLSYLYYDMDTVDDDVLKYSDAKRKRLGLKSIAEIPESSWVYGEMIDNNPRNLQGVLDQEAEIKAQMEAYRAKAESQVEREERKQMNREFLERELDEINQLDDIEERHERLINLEKKMKDDDEFEL